jgi:hypothetical protein
MSELIQQNDNRATIRWKLLTGASALALVTCLTSAGFARAGDASHPLVWLELDGQFAQQKNDLELFNPSFLSASPFDAHLGLEKTGPNIWDKGAKISFQPTDSDWVLSLGLRYGKSARKEINNYITKSKYHAYQNFSASSSESHTIVDFQAGRDVGLGRFGSGGKSVFGLGVRYAQFNSRNHVGIQSQPVNIATWYGTFHRYYATFGAARKFTGIGPALSWDGSAAIAGNQASGSVITLDWGLNGALLFGRQRTKVHHQTTNTIHIPFGSSPPFTAILHYPISEHAASPSRSRSVTVPNLGGFAGVSWRYADAKVSLGYRADMFFGAIDGGIDAAKKENRAFYGPYASVSIGIGD